METIYCQENYYEETDGRLEQIHKRGVERIKPQSTLDTYAKSPNGDDHGI